MKMAKVRELLHAIPFRPFWVHLADGGRIAVEHEDFVALEPGGREMIVYLKDNSHQIIDLLLVTCLQVKARNGAQQKRKR